MKDPELVRCHFDGLKFWQYPGWSRISVCSVSLLLVNLWGPVQCGFKFRILPFLLKRISCPVQYFWIGGMTIRHVGFASGWCCLISCVVEKWSCISVNRFC